MTRHHLTPTLTALNREWVALCAEHSALPARWRLTCGRHAVTDGLAGVLDAITADPDAVLVGLLSLQRAGESLAGRVVIQAFLGKLVRMAAADSVASLPDYLGAMWERVVSYPVARRRQRVAANLVLDTLKTVKSLGRQQGAELPGWEADFTPWRQGQVEPWGDAERVLSVGVALGAITPRTRAALHSVYVEGRSSTAAGVHLGASAAAVRQRCSQGVRALRAIAPELLDELAG